MPLGKKRDKVVYGLGAARDRIHRYTVVRWIVGVLFTASVAWIAWGGILRFDLWGGHHVYRGEELGFVEVARRFAFPFLAINIAILLVTRFAGRYLCGFMCPVGSIARLFEWARFHSRRGHARFLGYGFALALCLLLAAITFSFWVDWRVFTEGSTTARIAAGTFLLATAGALFLGGWKLGLRFCRDYCPSGVYFAVLGPKSWTGIQFAHPDSCTDCKACEASCPVDLSPREMLEGPDRGPSGLYPDGLSNLALCLRCGDCVAACEGTTARNAAPTPLRLGVLPAELREGKEQESGVGS